MWPGASHWPDFMNPTAVSWWEAQIRVRPPASQPLVCVAALVPLLVQLPAFSTNVSNEWAWLTELVGAAERVR